MDTGAGAKYVSDDEDGDGKKERGAGSKAGYLGGSPTRTGGGLGYGDKASGGVGAGAGGRSYVADVGEPKSYNFSVNKNPINVER